MWASVPGVRHRSGNHGHPLLRSVGEAVREKLVENIVFPPLPHAVVTEARRGPRTNPAPPGD
jgi:hypothetical protein